jgi:Tol biopolymer transport system component
VPGVPGSFLYAVPGSLSVLEPSTKNKRDLVSLPSGSLPTHPAVSPDGRLIAFGLYKPADNPRTPGGTDLMVVGRDGAGMRVVLAHDEPLSYAAEPAWTPDGAALYFTYRSATGSSRVERVNLDGTGRTPLRLRASNPTVSPDGRRIVYVYSEPNSFIQSIWTASADGSGPRSLLDGKDFDSLAFPRMSRDGERVLVAAVGGPGVGVPPQVSAWGPFVEALETRRVEALETHGGGASPAFESPSRRLRTSLWQRPLPHGVPWDLWLMKADGSDLRRITDLGEDGPVPVWSPDGRWIAFAGEYGIYLMTAEGKNLVRISDEWVAGGLAWLP